MLLLLLAAAPVALQPAADCPRTTSHHAIRPNEPVWPRKLGQLPDANAYAAVYRRVRGCEVPVVVRYGIGTRR
ncbi:hypothetical protein [Sphingomonas sp.]|uniref:hypothetical protein n=1 Tax=Sphingomonas sp. TaxID=28214 RepID=UPI00286E635A|nr:hypothetical protein [Sphingomonas sp.]